MAPAGHPGCSTSRLLESPSTLPSRMSVREPDGFSHQIRPSLPPPASLYADYDRIHTPSPHYTRLRIPFPASNSYGYIDYQLHVHGIRM
ncbi:hypothetical protein BV20DRAFT_733802 [Pilatotrama ljubarskyi]|nr:hypothetical protein BV20DRAFT_733802 [Pilatotrama ljubarskyi]